MESRRRSKIHSFEDSFGFAEDDIIRRMTPRNSLRIGLHSRMTMSNRSSISSHSFRFLCVCLYLIVSSEALRVRSTIISSLDATETDEKRTRERGLLRHRQHVLQYRDDTFSSVPSSSSLEGHRDLDAVLLKGGERERKGIDEYDRPVFLELNLKAQTEVKCFGICTAIAITIAIAAAAALGATIGLVVSANQAMLKLQDAREDIEDSKIASCVVVRQIAFETKSFQIALRSFAQSVRVVVPPRSPSSLVPRTKEKTTTTKALERLRLARSTPDQNREYLQIKIDDVLENMKRQTKDVLNMLDALQEISCGSFTSGYENEVRRSIVDQHAAIQGATKQLVMDSIAFAVAALSAGLGFGAEAAVGSAGAVVQMAKDAVDVTVSVADDVWTITQTVLAAVEAKAHHANGHEALAGVAVVKVLSAFAKNHVGQIGASVTKKMGKALQTALSVGLGLLNLGLVLKKVVDRFAQLFDSRAEYDARIARSYVSAYLFRAEKKNAECSLINDVRMVAESQNRALHDVLDMVSQVRESDEVDNKELDELLRDVMNSEDDESAEKQQQPDDLITTLCNENVQMCYRMINDALGRTLRETGAITHDMAKKLTLLATTGPITDLAISTNSDEALILRMMGYEVATARPLEKSGRRLWFCRMCSRWPIANLQFTKVTNKELSAAMANKKSPVEDLAEFFVANSGPGKRLKISLRPEDNAGALVEYLKLGPDSGSGAYRYAVFLRPKKVGHHRTTFFRIPYDIDVLSVDTTSIGGVEGYSDRVRIDRPLLPEGKVDNFAYHFAKRLYGSQQNGAKGYDKGQIYRKGLSRTTTQVMRAVFVKYRFEDFQNLIEKTEPLDFGADDASRIDKIEDEVTFASELSRIQKFGKAIEGRGVGIVDTAWFHVVGYCDRARVTHFLKGNLVYFARGLARDGRSLVFVPVTEETRRTLGKGPLGRDAWAKLFKPFDPDQGALSYCRPVEGGWMSKALRAVTSRDNAKRWAILSQFDVAFTLDGKHDPLALMSKEAGWKPTGVIKLDEDALFGFSPATGFKTAINSGTESSPFSMNEFMESTTDRKIFAPWKTFDEYRGVKWGSTCQSLSADHICAIDRNTIPINPNTGDEVQDRTKRNCMCMLRQDMEKINKIEMSKKAKKASGLNVGDFVDATSCKKGKTLVEVGHSDSGAAVIVELVENENLTDEELEKIYKADEPDRYKLYKAIVVVDDDATRRFTCDLESLKAVPKWSKWDNDTDGEDQSRCVVLDPLLVLVRRDLDIFNSAQIEDLSSKSFLSRATKLANDRYDRAHDTFTTFLCDTQDRNAEKAVMRSPSQKRFVQSTTCRFRDDPARVLASTTREEEESEEEYADKLMDYFPLFTNYVRGYQGVTRGNNFCSWAGRSPRHGGMTLRNFMYMPPYEYLNWGKMREWRKAHASDSHSDFVLTEALEETLPQKQTQRRSEEAEDAHNDMIIEDLEESSLIGPTLIELSGKTRRSRVGRFIENKFESRTSERSLMTPCLYDMDPRNPSSNKDCPPSPFVVASQTAADDYVCFPDDSTRHTHASRLTNRLPTHRSRAPHDRSLKSHTSAFNFPFPCPIFNLFSWASVRLKVRTALSSYLFWSFNITTRTASFGRFIPSSSQPFRIARSRWSQ